MTTSVRELLEAFDRLPDPDRREAAAEILRRTLHLEFPPLKVETSATRPRKPLAQSA